MDKDILQERLDGLCERGGRLELAAGAYERERPLWLDGSGICLSGECWACNTDPNGVFETRWGSKLRMRGTDYAAICIGRTCDPISGAAVRELGVQGDIPGMDTRPLVNAQEPWRASGLCLDAVRTDQCEFSRLSFCGLANGVYVGGAAEVDACVFEKINVDGCANGFYFAPQASYYAHIRQCVIADNPYYGIYVKGRGRMHNLEIFDNHLVRNGGCFTDEQEGAAIFLDGAQACDVCRNLIDAPGVYWHYPDGATRNDERQPSRRTTVGLRVKGNGNRIRDNVFRNGTQAMLVEGDGNVILNNLCDGDIEVRGQGNVVHNVIFTKPQARLIVAGEATVMGVPQERIIRR